jgi:Sec-independent protein secretion pathway component TatC
VTPEQNSKADPGRFRVHLEELNSIARMTAFVMLLLCIFWSFTVNQVVSTWLELVPLPTGPNNENLSVYGPFDWIQMRWSVVILLSMVTMLPMVSVFTYKFAKPGLFPRERNWLIAVLILTTTVVPFSIVVIWAFGIPTLFDFIRISGTPEGILVRYDAASIFSLGLGFTWVMVVWSITTITLSLSRVFGMVSSGKTRFRNRLLAISSGIIILTLPVEYDGLKLLIAIMMVFLADAISQTAPVKMTLWGPNGNIDSTT